MFLLAISEILGTAIVLLVLVLISALIIIKLVRDKKAGKSSCGCGCAACPMSSACHAQKNSINKNDTAKDLTENA